MCPSWLVQPWVAFCWAGRWAESQGTPESRVGVLPERGHPVQPGGQADTASSSPVFCVCDSAGVPLLPRVPTPELSRGWLQPRAGAGVGGRWGHGACKPCPCPFVGVLKGQEGSRP